MTTLASTGVSVLDIIALLWFLVLWMGYIQFTKRKCLKSEIGLLAAMHRVRQQWARVLLKRENRIVDGQILYGMIRKETFFASTTILILASSIALMGMSDEVLHLFQDIPFAQKTSSVLWELKVTVLILIFMFAFFKFTWSIRQHSYCSSLLGALPDASEADSPQAKNMASRLADLSSLASNHFNDGLRSYYFALAELAWFFHPVAFMLASSWVVIVLYRREYHSKALSILTYPQS